MEDYYERNNRIGKRILLILLPIVLLMLAIFLLFRDSGTQMVAFDKIEYTRPSLEELRGYIEASNEAMEQGADFKELTARLDDCFFWYTDFDTMYTVADIRSCHDLTDEYYAEEYAFCADAYAEVQQLFEGLYYACAACELAEELEEDYFWPGFREEYSDESESTYSDELVALMQRESALLSEYRALTAEPTVTLNGEETDLYTALYEREGEAYTEALLSYYRDYNEPIAEIYLQMIELRNEQAALLGFESYEEMQYLFGFGRDYTPEEAAAYLRGIRREIVPVYREVMAQDPYAFVWYDTLGEGELYSLLGSAARGVGGAAEEAFEFMGRYKLFDIAQSSVKANMSFETYLAAYDAPYLFLDPYGDTEDILSFAHEFGHYCDAYVNGSFSETVDLSEVYSQALEYLSLTLLSERLDEEELQNLADIKLLGTLDLYVQQGAYAEFEQRVYRLPPAQRSAEGLNALFLSLTEDYGFCPEGQEELYSYLWMDVSHFFEQPFYVISYPVSNDLALQIYARELETPGQGLETYLAVLPRDFSDMLSLAEAGELESPFAEGRLAAAAALLKAHFDR